MGFIEKVDALVNEMKKKREADARDFRKAIQYLRLDDKDIDSIINELEKKKKIEVRRNGNHGYKVVFKND